MWPSHDGASCVTHEESARNPIQCCLSQGFDITEQPVMNITNLPSVKGQLQFPTLSNCTESIHDGHVVQDTMAHKLIAKGPYQTHARRIPRQARWTCRPILLKARPRSNKVASSLQPAAQDGLKLNPDGNKNVGSVTCAGSWSYGRVILSSLWSKLL